MPTSETNGGPIPSWSYKKPRPDGTPFVAIGLSENQLTTVGLFERAASKIQKGADFHASSISAEMYKLAGGLKLDNFDVHIGTSREHGKFGLLALRVHSSKSLKHDWIILPDGRIFTAESEESRPILIDLDTFEHPDSRELVEDEDRIINALAFKAGLLRDKKTGNFVEKTEGGERNDFEEVFLAIGVSQGEIDQVVIPNAGASEGLVFDSGLSSEAT